MTVDELIGKLQELSASGCGGFPVVRNNAPTNSLLTVMLAGTVEVYEPRPLRLKPGFEYVEGHCPPEDRTEVSTTAVILK